MDSVASATFSLLIFKIGFISCFALLDYLPGLSRFPIPCPPFVAQLLFASLGVKVDLKYNL